MRILSVLASQTVARQMRLVSTRSGRTPPTWTATPAFPRPHDRLTG